MGVFKTTLIDCQQCGRRIMVRAADAERGVITCSHVGCGAVNILATLVQYDEAVVQGLSEFGYLSYVNEPKRNYPLRFGDNIIGTSESCAVQVERFQHNGRCFISRRHCTLTVTLDKWTGQLRYLLQDGAVDSQSHVRQHSLNGTLLNGLLLQKTEIIDVDDGAVLTLGGVDRFRLSHYRIPTSMLETYQVKLDFNPDHTQ